MIPQFLFSQFTQHIQLLIYYYYYYNIKFFFLFEDFPSKGSNLISKGSKLTVDSYACGHYAS